MKKLMTLMLGLSLVVGTTALFASPKAQDDTKKETKKKKKSKKKKSRPKEETRRADASSRRILVAHAAPVSGGSCATSFLRSPCSRPTLSC